LSKNTLFLAGFFFTKKEIFIMNDFKTYLSTAPVLTLVSLTVVAGLLIEINRFFPDALIFAF
jgi:photosystem I subunit 9